MIRLGQQSGTALGVSFLVSLAIALWSATSGVKAIFDGLNVAYEEEEKRSFFKLTAIALMFTIGLMVFVILLLAAIVALPIVLNYFPLAGLTNILLKIARWPILRHTGRRGWKPRATYRNLPTIPFRSGDAKRHGAKA